MNNLLIYMVKANSLIVLFYICYRIFLHRQKVYQLNRFLLIGIPVFALLIPWIRLDLLWSKPSVYYPVLLESFNELPQTLSISRTTPAKMLQVNWAFWVGMLYLTGSFLFLSRIFWQGFRLFRLKKVSVRRNEGRYLYIFIEGDAAFSFFRWIFIPRKKMGTMDIIAKHEQIHARQMHSLDQLYAELIKLLFWYNPCVYLLHRRLKETHEFIADNHMIRATEDVSMYLKELLLEAETRVIPAFVAPFRSSALKERVRRMLTKTSSRGAWFSYALFLPFALLLFLSFSRNPLLPVGKNVGDIPHIKPLKSAEVTLRFGYSGRHPVTKENFIHKGIDLKSPLGEDVVAGGAGLVTEASEAKGWGKHIIIQHDDDFISIYAHLEDFVVVKGAKVKAGDLIGHVGNTGYSTGPHLHYEIRKDGESVDPEEYFGEDQY